MGVIAMDISWMITFLGYMTGINFILIVLISILVHYEVGLLKLHKKSYGLSDKENKHSLFKAITHYKILFLVFNLVPYITLLLIGS